MKRKITIIISLLCAVLAVLAMDKQQEQVNEIKKSKEYLYGEATMPTQEEATSVAYELLQQEVLKWAADRVSRPFDKVSPAEINKKAEVVVLRRADMYRVFAYVRKTDLVPIFYDKGIVLFDSLDLGQIPKLQSEMKRVSKSDSLVNEEVMKKIVNNFFTPKNDVLDKIKMACTFFELKDILLPLKENGIIAAYGKYVTAEKPEECYLIIYDIAGNIKALLGKGDKTRPNLKTGKEDSLQNYRGCGAIWFTLTEK